MREKGGAVHIFVMDFAVCGGVLTGLSREKTEKHHGCLNIRTKTEWIGTSHPLSFLSPREVKKREGQCA